MALSWFFKVTFRNLGSAPLERDSKEADRLRAVHGLSGKVYATFDELVGCSTRIPTTHR